jgi:hypothetical protein
MGAGISPWRDEFDRKGRLLRRIRRKRFAPQFLFQGSQLLQEFVRALGFLSIYPADRKPNVHHHIVSDFGFRDETERNLAGDAAELHPADFDATDILLGKDLSGDR